MWVDHERQVDVFVLGGPRAARHHDKGRAETGADGERCAERGAVVAVSSGGFSEADRVEHQVRMAQVFDFFGVVFVEHARGEESVEHPCGADEVE